MAWWMWMGAGVAVAALALFLYVMVMNWIDERGRRKRMAVSQERTAAEHEMQKIVQNTISEMLNTARMFR